METSVRLDPVLLVALAFGLFAATHIGLALPPVRRVLSARLGRWGFTGLFTAVAWLTSGIAVATYAAHAGVGRPGLALGRVPALRPLLVAAIALGVMLMCGAFANYARSPYALGGERVREPRGLERVTRHPFLVGFALFGAAHALLATRLTGAVAMGSMALFAVLGAGFQDRKLLALRGAPHADYLSVTSMLPFAAIAAGRQRLVWRELPFALLGLGLVLAWALRAVHAQIFAHGGAYVIGALVVGPLVILMGEWQRDRRARRRTSAPARA